MTQRGEFRVRSTFQSCGFDIFGSTAHLEEAVADALLLGSLSCWARGSGALFICALSAGLAAVLLTTTPGGLQRFRDLEAAPLAQGCGLVGQVSPVVSSRYFRHIAYRM